MLEGLDRIDWSQLSHAYGEASDVPDLIRTIAYGNTSEKDEAYNSLYGNIWHQGTVYEATAYTVPFFIEMLDNPNVDGKDGILELLQLLASGSGYLEVHQHLDDNPKQIDSERNRKIIEKEVNHVKRAYDAVVSGYETYIKLLDDQNIDVKIEASWLLSICGEHQVIIEPILRQKLESEHNSYVARNMLTALTYLWHQNGFRETKEDNFTEEQHDYLKMFLESDDIHLRYASLLSLIQYSKGENYARLLNMLTTIVNTPDLYDVLMFTKVDQSMGLIYEIHPAIQHEPRQAFEWLLALASHPHDKTRSSIVMRVSEYCRTWRWAINDSLSTFRDWLSDENEFVRLSACSAISQFYPFSKQLKSDLERALNDPNQIVRQKSENALKIIESNQVWCSLHQFLQTNKIPNQPPLDALILKLSELVDEGNLQVINHNLNDLLKHLANYGTLAHEATPLLHHMIEYGQHWLRIYAIRALWEIDKTQVNIVLESLLAELQPRPAVVLVVDCLGDLGHIAEPAIEKLKTIAYGEQRYLNLIPCDEELQVVAKAALEKIENALGH